MATFVMPSWWTERSQAEAIKQLKAMRRRQCRPRLRPRKRAVVCVASCCPTATCPCPRGSEKEPVWDEESQEYLPVSSQA